MTTLAWRRIRHWQMRLLKGFACTARARVPPTSSVAMVWRTSSWSVPWHPIITQYLLQAARTYIFTTASPPAVAHAVLKSLELMRSSEGDARRTNLVRLQAQLRAGIERLLHEHPHLGWQLVSSDSPVQPLIIGENAATMQLAARLDAVGLRVPGIRPPTVPKGTARLRITLCATHTEADIERLLQALSEAAVELA